MRSPIWQLTGTAHHTCSSHGHDLRELHNPRVCKDHDHRVFKILQ